MYERHLCYTFVMNALPLRALLPAAFPPLLHEIPQPPKTLWAQGALPPPELPLLAVVGSRDYTTYGKQVVNHLIGGLRHYQVGIVSGLALGIDTLAHEAALASELYTMAVPGSGLAAAVLYPARNKSLAERIVAAGGGLLSELPPETRAATWTFPQRNRIMAGMCKATLLIEAGERSGTLITARMATDYNRELLVVPGSIFSPTSLGTHQFLKLGATPVTTALDIVDALQLAPRDGSGTIGTPPTLSPEALLILRVLKEPIDRDTLIRTLDLPVAAASILLMQVELEGHIIYEGGLYTPLTPLP
jgi:DNA processing protein